MLHITNGDSVGNTLVRTGLPGDIIAWRDILHDGPVPAGLSLAELRPLRARFIVACGLADSTAAIEEGLRLRDAALEASLDEDEIVLWFEHDLYDQLQLLQLLDWFASRPGGPRLSLVQAGEHLGPLSARELLARFPRRQAVTTAQREGARSAWRAFRDPDPRALEDVLRRDLSPLPFLAAALRRHLAQFPASGNGLSRSEQFGLEILLEGPLGLSRAFRLANAREEAAFLGDTTFFWYLRELGSGADPLVAFSDGNDEAIASLTPLGREVVLGREDRIARRGIDRWLGGVHLCSPGPIWRWDAASGRLLQTAGA